MHATVNRVIRWHISKTTSSAKTQTHLLVPHVLVIRKAMQQHNSCRSFSSLITHGKVEAVSLKAFDATCHDCSLIDDYHHVRQLGSLPEQRQTTVLMLSMAFCMIMTASLVHGELPPPPPPPGGSAPSYCSSAICLCHQPQLIVLCTPFSAFGHLMVVEQTWNLSKHTACTNRRRGSRMRRQLKAK